MDVSNTITVVCTAIGTVVSLYLLIANRFNKIEAELKSQSDRVSRLEGEMGTVKSMLQTVISYLLDNKAG